MGRNVRNRTVGHVRLAKIQIRLRIRRIFTGRILDSRGCKVSWCLHEQSDQTVDTHTPLWVHMSEGTFSPIAAQILE